MITTVLKSKVAGVAGIQRETYKEPQRLSKAGQWMRENPSGILEYVDWEYINRIDDLY